MEMGNIVTQLQEGLIKDLNSNWDVDDHMEIEWIRKSPLGIFTEELHLANPLALRRLTFFSALKAMPCWKASYSGTEVIEVLRIIQFSIEQNVKLDELKKASRPMKLPRRCSLSETLATADAATFCAKYIVSENPVYAAYSISGADIAYDHIYVHDNYREWLIDVALPIAVEKATISDMELNLKSQKKKNYTL